MWFATSLLFVKSASETSREYLVINRRKTTLRIHTGLAVFPKKGMNLVMHDATLIS
jgi:hypothetical protein